MFGKDYFAQVAAASGQPAPWPPPASRNARRFHPGLRRGFFMQPQEIFIQPFCDMAVMRVDVPVRAAGSIPGVHETRCAEVIMVSYTDMSTGRKLVEAREEYGEEVLLANWLPQPELGLALQEAVPPKPARRESEQDVEAFLRAVYLSQE
jgi:hypothetical protein